MAEEYEDDNDASSVAELFRMIKPPEQQQQQQPEPQHQQNDSELDELPAERSLCAAFHVHLVPPMTCSAS